MTATQLDNMQSIELWANAYELGQRNGGYATFRGTPSEMPDCEAKTLIETLPKNCDVAMRYGPNGWQAASIPCCARPGSCVHNTLYFPSFAAKVEHIEAYLKRSQHNAKQKHHRVLATRGEP